MYSPVAILTDFTHRDWYTASMQGVILTKAPGVSLVTISNSIEPGNIHQGAFVLFNCYQSFPPGTVFLTVIDPGVGSPRKPICLRAGGYFFVGPDNGVFGYILENNPGTEVREILTLQSGAVSTTFHGRDIFAPCAADLALGKDFSHMGPKINHPETLEIAQPIFKKDAAYGKIIYCDAFGNCMTNLRREFLREIPSERITVLLKSGKQVPFKTFYREVPEGEALCLWGSNDWLEISLNSGSAARELGLKPGDEIIVSFK